MLMVSPGIWILGELGDNEIFASGEENVHHFRHDLSEGLRLGRFQATVRCALPPCVAAAGALVGGAGWGC